MTRTNALIKGAEALIRKLGLPVGLPPIAVRACGLTDPAGVTRFHVNAAGQLVDASGNEVAAGDEGNDLGTLSTIAAGDTVTVGANSQAVIYGHFYVYGTLRIIGRMRFLDWP